MQYSWKVQATFVITGVFVGLLMTAQFRSAIPASSYPYDEYQAEQDLIKSYSDDQAVLKTRIQDLRQEIDDKQKQFGDAIQKNNLDTLDQLQNDIGLVAENGDGLQINLDDGPFAQREQSTGNEQSLVQAADLRDIVNLAFTAQAQAISINNQRIIASSPITSVGNTILVNNSHVLPPFTINIIGDTNFLLQRFEDPKVLIDLQKRVKSQKIQYTYKPQKNLVVPVYNGDFPLNYVQAANSPAS